MFDRLQKKWKVNGLQLALVLCTFAIGGSLTGYVGRRLMPFLAIEQSWLWIVAYILLITLLWPMAVLLVSIPFGQFRFFVNYLRKIGRRFGVGGRKSEVGSQRSEAGGQRLESRESEVRSQRSEVGDRDTDDGGGKSESRESEVRSRRPEPSTTIHQQSSSFTIHHSPLTTHHSPFNIAIFASGAGSNAQKIIHHFRDSSVVRVALIVCNKPEAGVVQIAEREQIPVLLIEKEPFFRGNAYVEELQQYRIGLVVLAGFLWKIPVALIKAYPGRIINIHPALLPAYGGKGMYGSRVHEAVIAAGETESGISIHYVDEHYDHGQVILQEKCVVLPEDTPDTLAQKIHALEHAHYPALIGRLASQMSSVSF